MLNITCQLSGFDEFIEKLNRLSGSSLVSPGLKVFAKRARQIAIDGTPTGDPDTDSHPGLMKKSWEKPKYSTGSQSMSATITNSVDYGVASNYGHMQTPGRYVPAINAQLVHSYVPGTYALEMSMDQAEMEMESVIRPEILKVWNDVRGDYYNRFGAERYGSE